ncbi:MAG: universal stress protein [Algibacter sp.]|uniref:universal stress protein n=1 Tax=Algibacter sp. TaxID=1872428 RepID=UPI002639D3F7|nr:universal stress protein [Algibacter sp.]MDG1730357.1 universal stress protein [Algibacter sp.]MDG2178835.1 universal stress protein [Algibacter sp.]
MKTILYSTDCTDNDASTLKYAYRLCSILKAHLHVLHVYDLPPIRFSTIQPEELLKKRMQNEQKDNLKKYCATHLKNEFHQKPFTIHAIENDSIVDSIVDISEVLFPDLIILGMKDKHSNRGFFAGNIANSLLGKIEIPVLMVPNGLDYNGFSTIVYATDLEQEDISSIKKLVEIASPFEALIEIIHVYEMDKNSAKESTEQFKNKLFKEVSYPEIVFRKIASADVKTGLKSVLKHENANILAMLERKQDRNLNNFFHKDLVKAMEASVAIPLLAFSKKSTNSKKINLENNRKILV